jgi:hypothetical protein
MATPLTLPPWIGLEMRRYSGGLVASNGVYRIVLYPSNYSKLVRLLLCKSPEPDALNHTVDRVVEALGHFGGQLFNPVQSLRPSEDILNFVFMYRMRKYANGRDGILRLGDCSDR